MDYQGVVHPQQPAIENCPETSSIQVTAYFTKPPKHVSFSHVIPYLHVFKLQFCIYVCYTYHLSYTFLFGQSTQG